MRIFVRGVRVAMSATRVPHVSGGADVGIWGARVLVVDDDHEMLEAAGRLLRAGGADVITVDTPGAALATIIGVTPDVIVVNITMAGLDAIGLLRAIRALSPEKGGQVPAITLAAGAPAQVRLKARKNVTFQGRLTKPFDPAKLVAMVDRLAGRAVERRQRALDRRHWPRDVSRERRAEIREGPPSSSPETGFFQRFPSGRRLKTTPTVR
jgi:CheY-like chemotaxis protein